MRKVNLNFLIIKEWQSLDIDWRRQTSFFHNKRLRGHKCQFVETLLDMEEDTRGR